MKLPREAHEVHQCLAAAYNSGDLATVMLIYNEEGIIVPTSTSAMSGKLEVEEAVKNILAIKGTMEIKTVYCLQVDDVAVGRSEWSITDQDEIIVSAKGIEVLKRHPDGTWRVLIDHAFGAENSLTAEAAIYHRASKPSNAIQSNIGVLGRGNS